MENSGILNSLMNLFTNIVPASVQNPQKFSASLSTLDFVFKKIAFLHRFKGCWNKLKSNGLKLKKIL